VILQSSQREEQYDEDGPNNAERTRRSAIISKVFQQAAHIGKISADGWRRDGSGASST
jgi:hypothetical protein